MGKLVVSTNVSLDGVVDDPDGKEGTRAGGWFSQTLGASYDAWAQVFTDEVLRADAILLGRRSDAWFAERWQSREGDWADRLNGIPKYVVSGTLTKSAWSNGTVLKGDAVGEVSQLKKEIGGEILVYGSYRLVHTLIEYELVDELRLFVFPVLAGGGRRLFAEDGARKPLRLLGSRTVGDGLTLARYEVVHEV